MTDYGLIAYNRTEEINRENLQHKFEKNLQNFSLNVSINSLISVATIITNNNELINFDATIYNTNYTIEVYVNNELNFVCKAYENTKFALYLSNQSFIQVKILASTDTATLNLSLYGNFESFDIRRIKIYSGTTKYMAVVTIGDFTKLIETTSLTELTEKINNYDGVTLFGAFVCGAYIEDDFYAFYNLNNVNGFIKVNNKLHYFPRGFANNSVIIKSNNETYPITLVENNSGKITATQIGTNFTIGESKIIAFSANVCVKKIFQVYEILGATFINNYLIFSDSLNNFYLVLCNNIFSALNEDKLHCIALGEKGTDASGFVLNSGVISVQINNRLGVTELSYNLVNSNQNVKKTAVNIYKNLTSKHYVNSSANILNFKGYVK